MPGTERQPPDAASRARPRPPPCLLDHSATRFAKPPSNLCIVRCLPCFCMRTRLKTRPSCRVDLARSIPFLALVLAVLAGSAQPPLRTKSPASVVPCFCSSCSSLCARRTSEATGALTASSSSLGPARPREASASPRPRLPACLLLSIVLGQGPWSAPSRRLFRPSSSFFPDLRFSIFPEKNQFYRKPPRLHAFHYSQMVHHFKTNLI